MNPSGLSARRLPERVLVDEALHLRIALDAARVLLCAAAAGAERARDADGLIQFLNGALDIFVGLEHRIGVEKDLNVRIELPCLALDRRRLAYRFGASTVPSDPATACDARHLTVEAAARSRCDRISNLDPAREANFAGQEVL